MITIDSKIDFLYGGLLGLIAAIFSPHVAVITVPACAILYAMGGDVRYSSAWRDVGCASIMSIGLYLATNNWLFLPAGVAVFGLLTVGLGLPSTQPPDAGSPVGRIAWRLAGGKEWLANALTHGFLYGSTWAVYFTVSILRGVFYA